MTEYPGQWPQPGSPGGPPPFGQNFPPAGAPGYPPGGDPPGQGAYQPGFPPGQVGLGEAQESGDSATVAITATVQGEQKTYTAGAQKQDGKWKVCSVAEGSTPGPGGGGGSAEEAKQTVQILLQAAEDRDLQTAQELTCEPLRGELEQTPRISSYTVGDASVSGESATVPFTTETDGEASSAVAQLERQSGTWKVCNVGPSGSGTGGPAPTGSVPTDFPTDFPTDLPTDIPPPNATTFCVTPEGSTPICIPD